ncbi:hypothetical protein ACOSP7_010439 [Xanthoceras sorbifolium]|uniref:Epidermal patterning factor-like protein n=1 Tax=Xanthoceras sorbifolium TaxID=99658 RepID=A0ABQ8HTJ9_9ROSI|nr:hypothetical protein JRO89_XS07G0096600 [Xanthoceras sorbifolium]
MGSSQNCLCCHRNRHLSLPLLFLLVSSFSTQVRFIAEGRAISKLITEAAQKKGMEEEKMVAVTRSVIGSGPPKCERRCYSCGHCKAVQVPVTTQAQGRRKGSHFTQVAYSRGDDISNYKPMSWKCKCGNLFFNP